MHENDRRFRSRVFSDVDPVLIPLHNSLLVDHHSLRKGCRLTTELGSWAGDADVDPGKRSCRPGLPQRLSRRAPPPAVFRPPPVPALQKMYGISLQVRAMYS